MSADMLGIGASGLRAARAALEVAGDNVANAATPGYARRALVLGTGSAGASMTPLSNDAQGGVGVDAKGIRRIADGFRASEACGAIADAGRFTASEAWLTPLVAALPSGEGGLASSIGALFDAASAVAADPNATAPRTAFLSAADTLARRFRTAAAKLTDLRDSLRGAIEITTARITTLAADLAATNDSARRAALGSAEAATAADRRDALLDELSGLVDIRTGTTPDGGVEVRFAASGAILVSGGASTATGTRFGPSGAQILSDPFGLGATAQPVGGGTLAGLLDAARRTAEASGALDRLATSSAAALNAAHQAGRDLAGDLGEPLFGGAILDVAASRANAGDVAVAATAPTLTGLDPGGYRLSYASTTGWTLARADGGASITGTSPLTLDGLTATFAGTPADTDNFMLTPGSPAAAMTALLPDPAKVAAADVTSGNGNFLALLTLRDAGFAERYDAEVTRAASALAAARAGAATAIAARDDAVAARDAISGVNLDDEASDILRFQQAYQAAARVISTARTLFDTLFDLR